METPVVGVVGGGVADGVAGNEVSDAVADAGARPVYDTPKDVCEAAPAAVVATDESALSRLVAADLACPVVPVGIAGLRAVPPAALTDAVTALVAGEYETASVPVVEVKSPLGETRALFDVMLVASEPARISEYTVRSRGDHVATVRADGVVAATPAGSRGYARRAGGPVVAPDVDAVTVVPVAPFSTDADRWVVPADDVQFTVERDETAVELLADDRTVGEVRSGASVRLTSGRPLEVAVVSASGGRFA